MKRLIAVFLLTLFLPILPKAQAPGTGAYPFAPLETLGFDQINLGNLNTRFAIPIVSRTGRGLPFDYSLRYEGLVWQKVSGAWVPDAGWGFHGQLNDGLEGYISSGVLNVALCDTDTRKSGKLTHYSYHDPFGTVHSFKYTTSTCPEDPPVVGDGSTSDGSGYSFDGSLVHDRNGRTFAVPINTTVGQGGLTDSNGNFITDHGNGTFTDTLGVTALTIAGAGTYAQPKTFTYPVTRQGSSDATAATATLYYTHYYITTNFGCSGVSEVGQDGLYTADLPDHIVLANGDTYSFGYELTPGYGGRITGRLATVTLPTGGVIHYAYLYGCGAGINPDGTPGSLKRSLDDGGTRTYGRSPITGTTGTSTTVTDESGNDTYYAFAIDSATGQFYQNHKHVFQGPLANNVALTDQYTCYNGATAGCDGNPVTLPILTVSTLNSYDMGPQYTTTSHYDKNGLLLDTTDELNRKTTYTYNGNAEILSVVTTTGSSQISSTTYGYDETAPTSTGTSIVQHTGATGTRGNQTSSHVWTGSATLDTTTTYYDTGSPSSIKTPSGTTSYGYDGTQAFVTSTNLPTPISGISLSTGASYDTSSTALLSSTGMNSDTTTVTSYDALMRPTQITPPAGGGTINISYSPNKTVTSQTMNGSQATASETFFDSYGRAWRTAKQTDNGWSIVDTCFDSNGRPQYISQTLLVGSDSNANVCHNPNVVPYSVYAYDALGRLKTFSNFDGTTTTYTYNSYSTKIQDENGVARITKRDPAGRTIAVCEVSSNVQNGVSPTACGLDIAASGFETTYTYNDATHSVTVTQGAQTRVFTTDAAGRLTSQQEPESGTTTYSYGYNGTGLLVTRKRPRSNQTSPTTLTTTTTQYDSIGRPVTAQYDDGITPNKTYIYDIASDGGINNYGASKGRLVQAQTDSPWAATWFYYDQMGRITRTLQCFPDHCGGGGAYDVNRWYNYDLAGNDTKETFLTNGCCGTQVDIDMAYTLDGEVKNMLNTLTGPSNAEGSLLSNVVETPYGPQSYTYGNNLNGYRVYDPVGRNWGRYLCSGTGAFQCQGATQLHGTQAAWVGVRTTATDDTIVGHRDFGYDEFNRLTSACLQNGITCTPGQGTTFTYAYDRYGNRLSQTATGGGIGTAPQASFGINAANNQIVATGYNYDAAGNLLGDHVHTYKYDAENNLVAADGETYYYDSLNHRVQMASSSYRHDIAYDAKGHRVSTWDGTAGSPTMLEVNFYWNDQPIAHWTPGATSSFAAIHATGVRDASITAACGTIWDLSTSALSSSINYQIRGGDTLEYDHLGRVGQGGMYLHFSSGAYSNVNAAGEDPTDYAPDGTWHHEVLALNPWATSVVVGMTMGVQASTPTAGQWDLYLSNAFIRSTDGSVHPLYSGGPVTTNLWSDCGGHNLAVTTDTMTNGGTVHFQHQDILGTERLRTNASGAVEGRYLSLPFGDGFSASGTDDDQNHFADLEQDATGTHHAQFRQYSSVQGRWMSPDAYRGSYDETDPQSLNRYAYVLNNPVRNVDPLGLYLMVCDKGGGYYVDGERQGDMPGGCTFMFTGADLGVHRFIPKLASPKPPVISRAPSKDGCNAQRLYSGLMGTVNLGLAAVKGIAIDGAVAGLAATGVGVPAAAALGVYGTVSTFGQGLAGAAQLYSAFTGNYGTPARVAQAGNILAGPVSGLGTLLKGGSVESAETNAGWESLSTAAGSVIDAINEGGKGLLTGMSDYHAGAMGAIAGNGSSFCGGS